MQGDGSNTLQDTAIASSMIDHLFRSRAGQMVSHLTRMLGPEHLEFFGSMANVIRAESEVVAALAVEGIAVLNDDDRISEIAEFLQSCEKTRIVLVMQANRWLVEHVQHASQFGAYLRGQADSLALASR